MNILGIDIGYSNLKLAFGTAKDDLPKTLLTPAGAAPEDRFGSKFDGSSSDDFIHVIVNDVPYIAGVSPDRAMNWSRSLHADYPSTDNYKALFKAGLLLSEFDKIDSLVTGLPVSQYFDESRRAELSKSLVGVHQITPRRSIEVKHVKVVAQPIGGFFDFIFQKDLLDNDARILVIDPGFFSVDWVIIANRDLKRTSSGTSHLASSVVLNEAASKIASDYGAKVSVEKLEQAVRAGKTSILVLGQSVDFVPYINKASINNSMNVMQNIRSSMRNEGDEPDVVVMVGGGVNFFLDAVKSTFPKTKIEMPNDAVFSNARGFWHLGGNI